MAKQITAGEDKAVAAATDRVLIRDMTSGTDKDTSVAGLAPAIAANIPSAALVSKQLKISSFTVDCPDIAPVNSTGPTDVPGSGQTFTVDVDSYLIVTISARQQRNVNDRQWVTLNVDGGDGPQIVGQGSATFDTARTARVPLAAGSHTIKLRYGCNSTGNGVLTGINWTAFLVAQ